MKKRTIADSFNNAIEGFTYVVKTQRNMRIHFLAAILVIIAAIYFGLSGVELLCVLFAATLVLVCEMINTSLELSVDLVKDAFHPVARIIKDIAAGAVFIASVNAVVVGYIVFSNRLSFGMVEGFAKIKQSSWHITFIALIVVLTAVVVGKVISKKGTPFRGGIISGHAAFAFSIWTIIAFISNNGIVTLLTLIMAVLIARHRALKRIHTAGEVVLGAITGVIVTVLIFQILQ